MGKAASRRRSILKPFDASDIRVREAEPEETFSKAFREKKGEPFVNPIGDTIVEREAARPSPKTAAPTTEPATKSSKFKQSRMGK